MWRSTFLWLVFGAAGLAFAVTPPPELFSPLIATKVAATANTVQNPPMYPQITNRTTGLWDFVVPDTWSSGFLPVTLYALNNRAKICPSAELNATDWVALGQTWLAALVPSEFNTTVGHDTGFLSFGFVEEHNLHPDNQTAIDAINNFASELAQRFNPIVGCTRSADTPQDPADFQVIIDNMMNLEVLFQSASLTGNHTLADIATSHADKTMQNHVRPDGSTFNLVDYNETTGAVVRQRTLMGFADNSTWTRGQAWGIYGFANMFRRTGNISYLETSRKLAQYCLTHMPNDGIVPWDFDAPATPDRPADSSAAMIAVDGMVLLAQQELSLQPPNTTGADYYVNGAIGVLANMTALAWSPGFQSLLANGTLNNPAGNNDTGTIYGDYYFVQAGNDLLTNGFINCDGTVNLVNGTDSTSSGSTSPPATSPAPSGSSNSQGAVTNSQGAVTNSATSETTVTQVFILVAAIALSMFIV